VPPANENRYVRNEVVIELAGNISPQAVAALAVRHRLTRLQSFTLQLTGTSFQRMRINDRRSVPDVVRALETDGIVVAVQPNYISTLQEAATPVSLPGGVEQYALALMRLREAHQVVTGSRILVAVIDGGVDTRHPELAGLVAGTFDVIGTGDRLHPHGTSIVGAIGARARLRGTAPGASILVARAFGTQRNRMDGTTANILLSIDWAVQRGARVINMSFAGARDPAVANLLQGAMQRGIVLVAAAGNAGPSSPPLYPAALPGVIAVTATDEHNQIVRAANRGSHITVAAPGVDLWLPTVDRGYRMTSGTSFAAAEVSGLIALLLERNPRLTPDQIRQALISTAHDLGSPGPDALFGAGLIDAYQAVMSVAPAAPAPVTAGAGTQ
jgi:subtilisin family serine protease